MLHCYIGKYYANYQLLYLSVLDSEVVLDYSSTSKCYI